MQLNQKDNEYILIALTKYLNLLVNFNKNDFYFVKDYKAYNK